MVQDRKLAREGHAAKVQGVGAKREHKQPYAAEVEDYAAGAVKTPVTDPGHKPLRSGELDDAADRLRPLTVRQRQRSR